jgi:2-polyprenyl-6-methoxyphenol hydroxylase-like FAD-dependent oxidoreductase
MKPHKIAIVGSGMGGLSAGMLLARLGHAVTLFERFDEPKSVGAGILIQPSGLVALERLGLRAEVEAKGSRIDAFFGATLSGRRVMDVRYADGWADAYGLGIHRGNLFRALYNAAREAGITLHCDTAIVDVSCAGDRKYVCHAAGQESVGGFDAVILANGTQSGLRSRLNVKQRSIPYPWGALWAICPDPEQRFRHTLLQRYHGASVMIGVLPTGLHPQTNLPCVSFFWSVRVADQAVWPPENFGEWKAAVLNYWPELDYLLQYIPDASALTFATYGDVLMKQWHDGGLLCIGDAGHGMSPQLGMGANLALIDAIVLADCVAQASSLSEAFARYSLERRRHLRYNQFASRWLTPFFQSDSRLAGWLRDFSFPLLHRVPPLYKQALRTIAGVKTGLLFDKSLIDLSAPSTGGFLPADAQSTTGSSNVEVEQQ